MTSDPPKTPAEVAEALDRLGVQNLVLAIHDACFPSEEGEDVGRGTPNSAGGHRFVAFARELGFDGLQLGPQGQTARLNQSPYDGTLFSRNVLSVDVPSLRRDADWARLIGEASIDRLIAGNPEPGGRRVQYPYAFDGVRGALRAAFRSFVRKREAGDSSVSGLASRLEEFGSRHADWLERDALFEVLLGEHDGASWRDWPELDRRLWSPPEGLVEAVEARRRELAASYAPHLERYAFEQLAAHEQHANFHRRAGEWGVKLYGDVQVGLSPRDAWGRWPLVLSAYRLGAPPSRTNPEGQPWNHSVLDPEQYLAEDGGPGPVLSFLTRRLGKMLDEFDGLRIDHPHGLVCPWVYRSDDEPLHAVQHGARLFSSPDLADHPGLARHALVRSEQLDRSLPRHADGWVRELEPGQVDRYACLFDAVVETARERGREVGDIICEVLSTQPRPLAAVMARHGLGRFRVTQKANLDRPEDVYRPENARPEDWIMVGNHDTAPIWLLARRWEATGENRRQAAHLARVLRPGDPRSLEEELATDRRKLVHAKVAELFVSSARNVMIFFADLLGYETTYNVPGTVNEENWTLRVPPHYQPEYEAAAARGEAIDLCRVLALALRARGVDDELVTRLEVRSPWW